MELRFHSDLAVQNAAKSPKQRILFKDKEGNKYV